MNFQTARSVGRLLALWLLMLCMTHQALAHTTGESYSTLSMGPTGIEVAYSLRLSVLTQLVEDAAYHWIVRSEARFLYSKGSLVVLPSIVMASPVPVGTGQSIMGGNQATPQRLGQLADLK